MKIFYIAIWILLMITTIVLLSNGIINPFTIAILFLLLLILCLEAVWLLYFGTFFTTKDDQVKNNKFYGGN